ncbi:MAG: hypothetical protein ACYSRZ_06055 [Planctomycetota bacterium]|jgi:hypothetical protein
MTIKKMYIYANSQILAQHDGIENVKVKTQFILRSTTENGSAKLRNPPTADDFKLKLLNSVPSVAKEKSMQIGARVLTVQRGIINLVPGVRLFGCAMVFRFAVRILRHWAEVP